MFYNTKTFLAKYSKRSIIRIIGSVFAALSFYYIKAYYTIILSFIGNESLFNIVFFGRAILISIFGHISVVLQLFFLNILVRFVISIAVLSFVSGVYILYHIAFIRKHFVYLGEGLRCILRRNRVFFDLQHAYLLNQRLIN